MLLGRILIKSLLQHQTHAQFPVSGTQMKGKTERKIEQQSKTLLVVYRKCAKKSKKLFNYFF